MLSDDHHGAAELVHRFVETNPMRGIYFSRRCLYRSCFDSEARFEVMAGRRRAIELAMGEEDLAALGAIARSRTESASRVGRARMLLAYREDPSFFAVGRAVGAHHQTVQRCVERALAYGPMAALDDRPRPGREATITAEAQAWVVAASARSSFRARRSRSQPWIALDLEKLTGCAIILQWPIGRGERVQSVASTRADGLACCQARTSSNGT